MNRLARHEQAQGISRSLKEASGARTLSFATKEVVDYLLIAPDGCTAVEIKTGTSRLKASQREWCSDPPIPTIVEYWDRVLGVWQMVKEKRYAPKAAD